MNALNADEEPKKTQPMMNTTDALAIKAQTGTPSVGCMRPSHLEPMSASSRAKDQVRREEVC
jgi:hypothetical protein